MGVSSVWDTSEMQIAGEMWIVGVRDTSETQNADVRNEIVTKIKYMYKVNLRPRGYKFMKNRKFYSVPLIPKNHLCSMYCMTHLRSRY